MFVIFATFAKFAKFAKFTPTPPAASSALRNVPAAKTAPRQQRPSPYA
jgi:hypothetical protein